MHADQAEYGRPLSGAGISWPLSRPAVMRARTHVRSRQLLHEFVAGVMVAFRLAVLLSAATMMGLLLGVVI